MSRPRQPRGTGRGGRQIRAPATVSRPALSACVRRAISPAGVRQASTAAP